MYAQLETILYRCRSAFASAPGEYDQACRQHDAEMDGIRQACLAKWGGPPLRRGDQTQSAFQRCGDGETSP